MLSRRLRRTQPSLDKAPALAWGLSLGFCLSCASPGELPSPPPLVSASRAADVALGIAEGKWSHVAAPPEDAEPLYPVALAVPVMERPTAGAQPVGYLRLGENVPRSTEPASREACDGGWFAVRPLGFVCKGDSVTFAKDHPLVRAFPRGPDRSKPLPYSYAFVRSVVPNYLKLPSRAEQEQYEMHLSRHLKNYKKLNRKWDVLEPGANQLVHSDTGVPLGTVDKSAPVPNMNQRYGGSGQDRIPWWLEGRRQIPNFSTFRAPPYAAMAGRSKRHAGIALVDSFVAGDEALGRRFAVSVDGRILPADKLKADAGSSFHGVALEEMKLPVAFAFRPGTKKHDFSHGAPKAQGEVPHKAFIQLTGKVKNFRGDRFLEAHDGGYYRSDDLKVAPEPSKLPWFAKGKLRWIDISILSQTLVLYEGVKPVYVTLISSGRDGLGKPLETLSTPTGTFRIYQKHVTHTMDSSVADSEFELRDVPWVQYFHNGYALHAAYWHDDFGRARSHGCVNLSPADARFVFSFTTPDVPADWHGAYAGDAMGQGTLVHIHP